MKTLIKQVARSAGYDIRKIEPPLNPDGEFEMANRNYRPPAMQYRRTRFGDDQRLKYICNFLDVRDLRVFEPGPYGGHHSILLEKMGVRENIAVESRAENVDLCQSVKNKYGLDRTTFLQGNIEDYYNGTKQPPFQGSFDLIFCVGVLYHVPNPGKALAWFRSLAKSLFLGTHYPLNHEGPQVSYKFNGRTYRAKESTEPVEHPLAGMSPISILPYESDLLQMLRDVGYKSVSVLGHDIQNSVPHVTIFAE